MRRFTTIFLAIIALISCSGARKKNNSTQFLEPKYYTYQVEAEYPHSRTSYTQGLQFVDGELLDQNGVKELAETPSKEVLIGRLMGSLQSGLYGFAYAIQAIIDKNEGGESAEVAAEAAAE